MPDLNPTQIPITRELFAQWQRVRGKQTTPASTPFGQNWDDLLARANLTTAAQEHDAKLFIRELETTGWLKTKNDRRRPDRILRLTIPLESEERWKQTFGFIPPQPTDTAALATHPWEPELQFCATARLQIRHDELAKIDHYLKHGGRARPMIPIKERSLQIFGDEKRLDELHRASTLFDAGRLTLETLRAYIVPEPLPWLRGACPTGPILTLENAATWDTFCRWDKQHPTFSALIYGGGNRFPDGIPHLATLHAELGFTPPHYYFGDLDPLGLRIPRTASEKAVAKNFPPIRPLRWAYRALLGQTPAPSNEANPPSDSDDSQTPRMPLSEHDLNWLQEPELITQTRALLAQNRRLAQEHINWEYMSSQLLNFSSVNIVQT